MTITSGFFDSVSSDRLYNAQQMSSIFDGIILDGVFSNVDFALAVVEDSGMNVNVRSGRAWFESTWTYNDANSGITVPTAHALLPRIDIVYLEVNKGAGVRANSFGILEGTPASSPIPPTWIDTSTVFWYGLAEIYVGAGVTTITQSNITSLIGTAETPWVKGPLINIVTDDVTITLDEGVLKVKDDGVGIAQITNKVRSLIIGPGAFSGSWGYETAMSAFFGSVVNQGSYIVLTNDNYCTIWGTVALPKDMVNNSSITVKALWFAKQGTGGVRFGADLKQMYNGVALTSGYPIDLEKTVTVSVQNQLIETTLGVTPPLLTNYPAYLGIHVYRWGGSSGDTLPYPAYLTALIFEYFADS